MPAGKHTASQRTVDKIMDAIEAEQKRPHRDQFGGNVDLLRATIRATNGHNSLNL